jgi:hypothetical protein
VGDTLPPLRWQVFAQAQCSSESSASFSNRLLILDFWATWCTSCYKKFPLLDSLQQQFGNRLAIRLVSSRGTTDDTTKIAAFFARRRRPGDKPYRLASIVGDTTLLQYFPHRYIPWCVWICNNRVLAITRASALTTRRISDLLAGRPVTFPPAGDEDRHKPSGNPGQ